MHFSIVLTIISIVMIIIVLILLFIVIRLRKKYAYLKLITKRFWRDIRYVLMKCDLDEYDGLIMRYYRDLLEYVGIPTSDY